MLKAARHNLHQSKVHESVLDYGKLYPKTEPEQAIFGLSKPLAFLSNSRLKRVVVSDKSAISAKSEINRSPMWI